MDLFSVRGIQGGPATSTLPAAPGRGQPVTFSSQKHSTDIDAGSTKGIIGSRVVPWDKPAQQVVE